jgi:competence protein ComEA
MKALLGPEAARSLRGIRRVTSSAKAGVVDALALARAWRWGAVLGRVLLAGLGLILLGAIGRSALARSMLSPEAPGHVDAGAVVAAPTSLPPVLSTPMASSAPAVTPAVTTPPPPSSPAPPASQGRATPDDPVYLNQATLADLHRLPGVGPKRAEAMIALRNKLGHFRQIEDLLKVKGIGRSSLRKLRPLVRLDPPPSVPTEAVDAAQVHEP